MDERHRNSAPTGEEQKTAQHPEGIAPEANGIKNASPAASAGPELILALETDDPEVIERLKTIDGLSVTEPESRNFDGGSGMLLVLITIGARCITALTNLLLERVKARRYVKIKHKGVVIEGVSEETLLRLLGEHSGHSLGIKHR